MPVVMDVPQAPDTVIMSEKTAQVSTTTKQAWLDRVKSWGPFRVVAVSAAVLAGLAAAIGHTRTIWSLFEPLVTEAPSPDPVAIRAIQFDRQSYIAQRPRWGSPFTELKYRLILRVSLVDPRGLLDQTTRGALNDLEVDVPADTGRNPETYSWAWNLCNTSAVPDGCPISNKWIVEVGAYAVNSVWNTLRLSVGPLTFMILLPEPKWSVIDEAQAGIQHSYGAMYEVLLYAGRPELSVIESVRILPVETPRRAVLDIVVRNNSERHISINNLVLDARGPVQISDIRCRDDPGARRIVRFTSRPGRPNSFVVSSEISGERVSGNVNVKTACNDGSFFRAQVPVAEIIDPKSTRRIMFTLEDFTLEEPRHRFLSVSTPRVFHPSLLWRWPLHLSLMESIYVRGQSEERLAAWPRDFPAVGSGQAPETPLFMQRSRERAVTR